MKVFVKFLIGLALLPACLGAGYAFLRLLAGFSRISVTDLFFLGGFLGYFLFELAFRAPIRTYVLGHELTHVLASLCFGGMPKSFRWSKKGGSVTLTRTNFIISLAPYMVPLYTLFLILCYLVVDRFFYIEPFFPWYVGLVGCSLAFHLRLTVFAIRQGQPDLRTTGVFFSLIVIVLVNFLVLAAVLTAVFPQRIALVGYLKESAATALVIYAAITHAAGAGLHRAGALIEAWRGG